MSTTAQIDVAILSAGMGQIVLVQRPGLVRAVVGSCVGLVLFHRRCGVGVLGHIVLPNAEGRPGPPGKFADTAIPQMLEMLREEGAHAAGLVAKMAGGGNMFGNSGPLQIGDANVEVVVSALERLRIPVRGRCVGGLKGRRLTLDCDTGDVLIEIVGESPRTI